MTARFPAALGLLALNGTLLAGQYACARIWAQAGVAPIGALAWQVLFAAAIVVLVGMARGQWAALRPSHLRYAGVAGLVGITGPAVVTYSALQHVQAGTVGVIGALSPAFTYLIAVARGLEIPRLVRIAGIVVGLVGVLAVVLPRGSLPDAGALTWALLALVSPMLLAAGNVYRSVAWPPTLPPLGAAGLMLALQAALLVPVAIWSGQLSVPASLHAPKDLALLGGGIMMAVFYLGAFQMQLLAGPVLVGQLGSVITLASLAIGVGLLGEQYSAWTLPAVATVLVGIWLAGRPTGPRDRVPGLTRAPSAASGLLRIPPVPTRHH